MSLNPTAIRLEAFAACHNKRMNMLCAAYVEREDVLSVQQIAHFPMLPVCVSNPNVFISKIKEMVPDYLCVMAT